LDFKKKLIGIRLIRIRILIAIGVVIEHEIRHSKSRYEPILS
jgi:hypothetical protein